MTDFGALKRSGVPVQLTDEQVDELLATGSGEFFYYFGLVAEMSAESAEKVKRAALGFKVEKQST
jgi:hypothetical protein